MTYWRNDPHYPWFPLQRHEWDSTGCQTGKRETWEEFEKRQKERYAAFDQRMILRKVTDEERERAKATKARLLARVLPVPDPVDGVDGSEDNT